MRIGILSDTHDCLERTTRAIELLLDSGAEALIHCGDLASPPIVRALAVAPSYFVFGNHDADVTPSLQDAAVELGVHCLGWSGVITLAGRKIAVAHGHLTTDIRNVLAEAPDVLLTGHAHYPFETLREGVRQINPGALFRAERYTVALLDLVSGCSQWLEIAE